MKKKDTQLLRTPNLHQFKTWPGFEVPHFFSTYKFQEYLRQRSTKPLEYKISPKFQMCLQIVLGVKVEVLSEGHKNFAKSPP